MPMVLEKPDAVTRKLGGLLTPVLLMGKATMPPALIVVVPVHRAW